MPDASVIIRQRLANAVIGGLISSNKTHSTMASIQKKLKIYGDAYGTISPPPSCEDVYTFALSSCNNPSDPPTGLLNSDGSFTGNQSTIPASNVFPVSGTVSVGVSDNIIFYNCSGTTYYYYLDSLFGDDCYVTILPKTYFGRFIDPSENLPVTFSFTTINPLTCPIQSDLFDSSGNLKRPYVLKNNCSLTLTGNLTFPTKFSIIEGSTLNLNGQITNNSGFSNNGTINLNTNSEIINNEIFFNDGTINYGGISFTNNAGGIIYNNGSIIVQPLKSITNNGRIINGDDTDCNLGTITGTVTGTPVNIGCEFGINNLGIEYDTSLNGSLNYYDFNTWPKIPSEVYVIEVSLITDNIDGTEFTTSGVGNIDNYDSYWFTSSPSQNDILTCMEDAYSSPVTLPASVIAVKATDAPDWIVNPPSSPPETIFVLVLPYGNNGTSFDLTVKKQNV